MEPVRPVVDGLVIELVENHQLARGDVYETREGVCRLAPALARRLAEWAVPLREPLQVRARALTDLVADGRVSPPARKRRAVIAGKGGKRRLAGRASA
jgi:CRISPR/Cas system-associated endonuclease Cas1